MISVRPPAYQPTKYFIHVIFLDTVTVIYAQLCMMVLVLLTSTHLCLFQFSSVQDGISCAWKSLCASPHLSEVFPIPVFFSNDSYVAMHFSMLDYNLCKFQGHGCIKQLTFLCIIIVYIFM